MKKNQLLLQGKTALGKTELQTLKGGISAGPFIWICMPDADCYFSFSACKANCSAPNTCISYRYCL